MSELTINGYRDDGGEVVALIGEVNLRTSPELHAHLTELIRTQPARIILDLSNVAYMDSSGVGTLVEVKRRVDKYKGTLILAGLQDRVRGVFEITRLNTFFTIRENVEQAKRP